jgi:PAS domain S-box-containing protein
VTTGAERLQLALDAGELGTWDWDLRADRIRWDGRTAAIFGMRLEDFDGRYETFATLVHPDDEAALRATIEQAIATCGVFERDYRAVTPAGEQRWVSVQGRVVCGSDGEAEAMLGIAQDRTDSVRAGERLARMLEVIDEAFFALSPDWRFTFVNARAEQLLGRTRAELLGQDMWTLFPDAVGSEFERRYTAVMETREPVTFEAEYGPLGWFEVRAYPDERGIAVYFRNVDERRARERREQRAHRVATGMLEVGPSLRAADSADLAQRICAAGIEIFSADRTSVWRIAGDRASLVAQRGGTLLPRRSTVGVDEIAGLREALTTGRPLFMPDAAQLASDVHRELARRKGVRSFALAPVQLGPDSEILLVSLGWAEVAEPLDVAMLDLLQRFAQQAALALEQLRRQEAEGRAAGLSTQLQASLLPTTRLDRRDVEVGTLYRTGERRLILGGDFLDCLELPDGSVSMVIGDVTGHGPEAAAIGATLRAAWRALALQGIAPAPKIRALDELLRLERDTDEQMVSMCCSVVAPDLRSMTIASAGHPPPLLLEPGGGALVDVPAGVLLGAPAEPGVPEAAEVPLPARWALLHYTDGLPEARWEGGEDGRLGLDAFAEMAVALDAVDGAAPRATLEALDTRVRAGATAPIEDDVALLLLRRRA